MQERVQKLMAQANIGSRRACEEIIRQGRVRVNGRVITLGDQADPTTDVIEVDGEKLAFPDKPIYIAFNKPRNVLSTDTPFRDDTRKTVREYVPVEGHLFIVGRLDADSEGLIVLTSDGDLAHKLTHPRYQHTKTYKVVVYGVPNAETIARWESGIFLEDGKTAPCSVTIVQGGKESTLRIIMTEGKKRQIRRVAALLGHPVKSLIRTHIGTLDLGSLRPGEWRELNAKDMKALKTPAVKLRRARLHPSSRPPAAGKAPPPRIKDDKRKRKPPRRDSTPGRRRTR